MIQRLAIHFAGQDHVEQIALRWRGTAFLRGLLKIGLDGARRHHLVDHLGAAHEGMFPGEELIEHVTRQAHQVEEHIAGQQAGKITDELAGALIGEPVDQFGAGLPNLRLQPGDDAGLEIGLQHPAEFAVVRRVDFQRVQHPVHFQKLGDRIVLRAAEVLGAGEDLLDQLVPRGDPPRHAARGAAGIDQLRPVIQARDGQIGVVQLHGEFIDVMVPEQVLRNMVWAGEGAGHLGFCHWVSLSRKGGSAGLLASGIRTATGPLPPV